MYQDRDILEISDIRTDVPQNYKKDKKVLKLKYEIYLHTYILIYKCTLLLKSLKT